MSEPRVIQADFANWRPVAGRKVLQLILEVPIEQTADVMEKLGVPMPGESKWCAVALLEKNAGPVVQVEELQVAPVDAVSTTASPPQKRKFSDMPLSQQAGMLCDDPRFVQYLKETYPSAMADDNPADAVRFLCGVTSRSAFDNPLSTSRREWMQLASHYQSWLTDRQYAGAHR